jgi:hypothetical protein
MLLFIQKVIALPEPLKEESSEDELPSTSQKIIQDLKKVTRMSEKAVGKLIDRGDKVASISKKAEKLENVGDLFRRNARSHRVVNQHGTPKASTMKLVFGLMCLFCKIFCNSQKRRLWITHLDFFIMQYITFE